LSEDRSLIAKQMKKIANVGEVIAEQMKKMPMWGKLRPDSMQKYSFMSKNLNRVKKNIT
jgi:hypothetical protein